MENIVVDMSQTEMMKVIEENAALKAALQKATAAFLYANGSQDDACPRWDSLPDEAYHVSGGVRSGRATYMAQAADVNDWMKYWVVV